jgi:DNA polymerase-3 subunit epsilon
MKNFKLSRPLVFLDLETTGLNPSKDRIVDITLLKTYPDGREESKTRLINPEMPIPKDSTRIHGITDEKVADEPTFRQIAKSFRDFLADCDLCGFNIKGFDIPMLEAEFRRAEVEFTRSGRLIIDTQVIFHKQNPRNLEVAYLKYCGKKLENGHTSDADARASAEILDAQLEYHDDLPNDLKGLHQFCCYPDEVNWIDQDGKLIWINDEVAINFGKKYKGVLLKDISNTDPGFLEWILRQDFSEKVVEMVSKALRGEYPNRPNSNP